MLSALASILPFNLGSLASFSTLLVLLGKATILLAAAMAVTLVMQRTSAVSRHLVWFASLAAILIIPLVIAASPLRFPILPSTWASTLMPAALTTTAPANQPAMTTNAERGMTAPTVNAAPGNAPAPSAENQNTIAVSAEVDAQSTTMALPATTPSLGTALLAVWAAIAFAFITWLLFGMWTVRRIVRNATPRSDDTWDSVRFEIADRLSLKDAPALFVSDDIAMPFACGFRTPTIVLPRSSDDWSDAQRTAVLLHEMAHIRRRDIVGHTVGRFACALYWFHPLVWTAAKRMRAESERACDDMALLCGARASDYAEHLLDIVARVKSNTTPPVAMAMATRKEFEGRMLAILDPALRRGAPSRRQSISLVASVVVMAIALGAAVPATGVADPLSGSTISPQLSQPTVAVVPDRDSRMDTLPRPIAKPEAPERVAGQALPTADPLPPRPFDDQTLLSSRSAGDDLKSVALSFVEMGLKASGDALRSINLNTEIGRAMSADTSERAALLTKILRTESQAELRRVAAWGLRNYAIDASVTEALANAVRRDTSAAVREMAAWSLESGNLGPVETGALAAAVRNDKSDAVKLTAVWSLASVRRNADSSTVNALLFALKDGDARIREMATWALGSIHLRSAPSGLLAMLRDSDNDVRYSAAWAVYEIGEASTADALDQALRNEKVQTVQLAQVRALTSLGEPAIAVIKRLLDDPDPQVKTMAVNALAGGRGAGPWPRPRPMPRPFP